MIYCDVFTKMHYYTTIKHELTIDLCDSTIEDSTKQNYMNNLYFKKQENNKHEIQNSGYLRRDTEVDTEKEHTDTGNIHFIRHHVAGECYRGSVHSKYFVM